MTVSVSSQSPITAQGSSIVVCEEAVGHHHRLPRGRHLPRRRRDVRHHPQDRQADHRPGRGRRADAGRGRRGARTTRASGRWSRRRSRDRRARSARSGCCRRRGPRAMRGRPATSAGWSPREARSAGRARQRAGRRPAVWSPGEHLVIDWGVLGAAACVLRGAGLVPGPVRRASPPTSAPTPRWRCSPSASRSSVGSRRSCSPTGWAV